MSSTRVCRIPLHCSPLVYSSGSADVHFLLEAGQLDRDDAQLILSKVPAIIASQSPAASAGAPGSRHHPGQHGHGHGNPNNNSHGSRSRVSLDITTDPDAVAPPSYPSLENVMNNVPVARGLPPAPKRQARALWDYNLNNEVLFSSLLIPSTTSMTIPCPHRLFRRTAANSSHPSPCRNQRIWLSTREQSSKLSKRITKVSIFSRISLDTWDN
jgi:hypothetical protein